MAKVSPDLDPKLLADAVGNLRLRIGERFPDSGLHGVATNLLEVAQEAARERSNLVAVPAWVRVVSWAGGCLALLLLLSPLLVIQNLGQISQLPEFLQSLDALITVVAAAVAGFFTMRRVEQGQVRKRALEWLAQLRAFAHVIDMHQVAKSPTRLLFPAEQMPSSRGRPLDPVAMSSYLTYCGELFALIAKLGVLCGEWAPDGTVLATVNDVEELCSDLERKTLEKVMLLEQLNHRAVAR